MSKKKTQPRWGKLEAYTITALSKIGNPLFQFQNLRIETISIQKNDGQGTHVTY